MEKNSFEIDKCDLNIDGVLNILITDDDSFSRLLIKSILKKIPNVCAFEAGDGKDALDIMDKKGEEIDLILLDLHMAGMSGYEFLEKLRSEERHNQTAVIVMTTDSEEKYHAIAKGADDFIPKPFDLEQLREKIEFCMKTLKEPQEPDGAADSQNSVSENPQTVTMTELEESQRECFYELAKFKYRMKPGKSLNNSIVSEVAYRLARRMGYKENESKNIHCAAAIRNIGLISIPKLDDRIKLTEKQRQKLLKHILSGYKLVSCRIDTGFIRTAKNVISQFKEHHDGSGAPLGLNGEEISTEAMIVAVADMFAALKEERPYRGRTGYKSREVYDLIKNETGSKLSPKVGHVFLSHFPEFVSLRDEVIKGRLA